MFASTGHVFYAVLYSYSPPATYFLSCTGVDLYAEVPTIKNLSFWDTLQQPTYLSASMLHAACSAVLQQPQILVLYLSAGRARYKSMLVC